MKQKIIHELAEIEKQRNIRILYACESGSRAWGFPSPDSDYDVRFIYVKPMRDYLSISEPNDVIEMPIDDLLDIGGWDLRKALRLFRKSNVALYEWLQSPIVYRQDEIFVQELKSLMPEYFSLRAGAMHYLGIAKGAWKDLQNEKVRIKKYFYCLRPILAARWIVLKKEIPPIEFFKLLELIDNAEVMRETEQLLKLKSVSDETTTVLPITVLHRFIEENLHLCEENLPETNEPKQDFEDLNELFRKQLI
ncbi:MAG: nucleotidyltransferase domain-containing protein [Bacteroidales bacterium]|jgi:predicted nucleotidyltransferase|nr:nucleotidyltransferase domain-containing protein [Bacteroidales bacterium]